MTIQDIMEQLIDCYVHPKSLEGWLMLMFATAWAIGAVIGTAIYFFSH